MSITKLIALTASVVMLSACAPAAQQRADLNQDEVSPPSEAGHSHKATKDNLHRATVKPGADVSLKSALPKSMLSGEFQTVKLEFIEGYQEGVMTVSLEPSDGLTLFGGSNSKTFNLSNPGPHQWDLDVKTDADGVYFLNVFAQAGGQARSFSVRLNIGVGEAISKEMFDEAMPPEGELTDGGKIRVLEADETIQ